METTGEYRAQLLAALAWQVELGADEAIAETPTDRTRLTPPEMAPGGSRAPAAAKGPGSRKAGAAKGAAKGIANGATPDAAEDAVQTARELAAKAADVPALREALLGYDGSSLKPGSNTVFADGNPAARVMVVGEAPGREEDRAGKPFVGRSGQLLDRMLAAIGLDRAAEDPTKAAYITNVIFYRPLGNRTPEDAEVQKLLPFTWRHIELARPSLVLCLGNVPAKHLMNAGVGITRYRGTWTDLQAGAYTVPALASFHPAYLLRQPEAKRYAWRDLQTLRDRLESL